MPFVAPVPPRTSISDVLIPPNALMAECIGRVGTLRGFRLASFVNDWVIEERVLGRPVGIEEFAERARSDRSRRTAHRRLVEFRQVFPEFGAKGTPHDLLAGEALPAPKAREVSRRIVAAYEATA